MAEREKRGRNCVVMGVSGCGKTTLARRLAERSGGVFTEGDAFHPQANIDKMSAGEPLDDDDRRGWLLAIAAAMAELRGKPGWHFVACSALRESHRDLLRRGDPDLVPIHLHGSRELLLRRLQARNDHFMPASLLDSQLATLESPDDAIRVDMDQTPEAMTRDAWEQLQDRLAREADDRHRTTPRAEE